MYIYSCVLRTKRNKKKTMKTAKTNINVLQKAKVCLKKKKNNKTKDNQNTKQMENKIYMNMTLFLSGYLSIVIDRLLWMLMAKWK